MEEKKSKNTYFYRKRILAIILTTMILSYAVVNLYVNRQTLMDDLTEAYVKVTEEGESPVRVIPSLESSMTDNAFKRMMFVELFSYSNVVLDKREIRNFSYIKDETGSLHYAAFYREHQSELFEYALRIKRLKDYVSEYDTDVLFVVAPSKYVADDDRFRPGMPVNDPQVVVNELLFYLNRLDVDTLDLNQYIPCDEVPYTEAFFRTDHHWTISSALYSTRLLAQTLNSDFGYELDVDEYLAPDKFTSVTYYDGMLGSMGRGTGACFSGVDDFTAYYPNYDMNFYRKTLEENGSFSEREGGIIGTLILPEILYRSGDIYQDSQYSIYLNGLRQYEKVVNLDNPEGKKIFMIRDSYFSPVISFLAPTCSEIDAMWSLEDSDQINIE